MTRIPDAELERLKRDASPLRLIESQGHELKKRGKDWVMRCVFHAKDTPSLSVSEEKSVYHCFGCESSGTVLERYQRNLFLFREQNGEALSGRSQNMRLCG